MRASRLVLLLAASPIGLLLFAPLVLLASRALQGGVLVEQIGRPIVVEAIRVSAATTSAAILLIVLLGTPAAYLLARGSFRGKAVLETLVELPIVLPPAVAGVALLLLVGRRGPVGSALAPLGLDLAFTGAAVVVAQVFVAAPYFIRAARGGFSMTPRDVEEAAAVDGAGPVAGFLRITLPLAMPAVSGGIVVAWAKALGEFGATIVVAGSLLGRTQTLPLAVYQALETDLDAALAIGAILLALSFAVIFLVRRLAGSVVPGG